VLDVFIKKIKNHEYISNLLYLKILENFPDMIPEGFDIDKYNGDVLDSNYIKFNDYFSNMYNKIDKNIKLDEEQIKAILAEEDYSLVIAGAGTGKTTTVSSLVKYLVDIKHVEPSKIAVMSYTKKATKELEKRILIDFDIPASITTFHSLGMMYIRKIFTDKMCSVVDENDRKEIFLNYFTERIFPYKDKVSEILELFNTSRITNKITFGNYFKDNFMEYNDYNIFFESYKKHKRNEILNLKDEINARIDKLINNEEVIYTINQEIVKSKGEAIIANFLYCNNISYKYEKIYKDLMEDRHTYKPDFTLDLGGYEVYIEYFGLSDYKDNELRRYNKIRRIKENYHKTHHTRFISIGCSKNEDIISELKCELIKMGFKLKPKTDEEIFDKLLDNNKTSLIFKFRDFLYKNIDAIKSSVNRKNYVSIVNDYINNLEGDKDIKKRQFYYINDFYLYYQEKLYGGNTYKFDFSDMIYYANTYMENVADDDELSFEYLIIDEYQDISQEKYEFSRKIAYLNKAKVVAVGDDWQSIYAFNGSKIDYIYNFQNYFPGAKIFRITNTYRNGQTLINYSGKFIMSNEMQIKKELTSNKDSKNPIKFIMFDGESEYETLKKLIFEINRVYPNEKILILGRTNAMINRIFDDPMFVSEINSKVRVIGHDEIDIEAMTIHKAKGLTSDQVIIIGLNETFPSSDKPKFWLESLFISEKQKEPIEYAEERRVFYVALTRTKNNVYILVNKDKTHRSKFINEIFKIIKEEK